ncbi:UNVERIFIED_CONTAM: Serine/threonine-protein kinase RIPK [Sesamum radiatum]|uniref:Serine/threonine-protein kinase RIPK n=1 Tax=Sesamum radiatum TaxID=300843 RepID=A0AAW2KGW5_SESRA
MSYEEITIIALVLLSLCVMILALVLFIIICKSKPVEDEEEEALPVAKLSASSYPLMEIDAATDAFNHRRIIGKGRLGTVYAAVMPKGELVAVKRIHPRLVLNNAGFWLLFHTQMASLADHPHVVPITGLVGYVTKRYWREKRGASKECDVFGFGVVLLELLSGRRSEQGLMVEWALPLIKGMRFSELLDPRLAIPSQVEPLVRLGRVALACVANSRKNRPSIAQVAAILSDLEMNF